MGSTEALAVELTRRPIGLLLLDEGAARDEDSAPAPQVYLILQTPASAPVPRDLSLGLPALRSLARSVARGVPESSVRVVPLPWGDPAASPPREEAAIPAASALSLVPLQERTVGPVEPSARLREKLFRLGSSLSEPRTPQEVAIGILHILEETFAFDFADVWLLEQGRERMVPYARIDTDRRKWCYRGDGYGGAEDRVARGEGILGWVAATGRGCHVPDVTRDPRYLPIHARVRSEVCVPLLAGGRVLGLINLESRSPRAYGPADEELLGALARQAAIAVENARLQEESRAANARIERTLRKVEEKNRELETLVRSFSHDLKNPLVALKGFAALLRTSAGPVLDDKSLRYLDRVLTNADKLEELLDSLLELSRAGRAMSAFEAVDAASVAAELVRDLALQIEAAGADVRIEPGMPKLWASRTALYQILSNLVGNALKFLDPGRPGRITIGASLRHREVRFHVRDNGIGIAAAEHARIFQPFCRLNEVESGGHGVGLAIARKLAESLGGKIWVDSAPGRGSTFFFAVPRRATAELPFGTREGAGGRAEGRGEDA